MANIGDSINDKLFNSLQIKIYTGATGSEPIPTSPSSDPGIISFNQKDQWIGINGVWYKTASSEAFDDLETIVSTLTGTADVTGSVAQQIYDKIGNLSGIADVSGTNVTDYTTSLYNKLHGEITGAEATAKSYTDNKISNLSGAASGTDGEFVTVTVNTAGGEVSGVSVNTTGIAKQSDLNNLQTAVTNMQKTGTGGATAASGTAEHVKVTVTLGANGPEVTVNETGIASTSDLATLNNAVVKSVNGVSGATGTGAVTIDGAIIDVGGTGSHSGTKIDVAIEDIYTQITDTSNSGKLKLYKSDGGTGATGVDDNTVHADGSTYILQQGGTTFDPTKIVAKFNIEKDSFVKNGEVVRGSYANNTFTPSETGEYYIHLTIGTSDPDNTEQELYIPAGSLVDVYTANSQTGAVQLSIDANRNITAAFNIDEASQTGSVTTGAAAPVENVTIESYVKVSDSVTVTTEDGSVTAVSVGTKSVDAAGAAKKAYATALGTTGDTATENTIYGAKAAAAAAQSAAEAAAAQAAKHTTVTGIALDYITITGTGTTGGTQYTIQTTGIDDAISTAASNAETNAKNYADTIISWTVY